MERTPEPGKIFYLSEDKPYQIITMGIHKETGESMVIYQALFGEFKTFVLPLSRFKNEVQKDIIRIQNTNNELHSPELHGNKSDKEQKTGYINDKQDKVKQDNEINDVGIQDKEPQEEVNAILLDFLDAQTYGKKLEVISANINEIDDRLINNMAVSVDCTVEDGPIDERIRELICCLNQKSRFEDKRLR